MKALLLILMIACAVKAHAGDALSVIEKEGHLDFTDGVSVYSFSRSGAFQLEPVEISGMTITGTWTEKNGEFLITGQWSWMNGISEPNDFRKMVIYVSVLLDTGLSQNHGKEMIGNPAFTKREVTKNVYFKIKDIYKIKISLPDLSNGFRQP